MDQPPNKPTDVRMRGFTSRALVDDVLAWIDDHTQPLGAEMAPFASAHSRVLAADIVSPLNVPAFDRSAMDGFAVRANETEGAGDYNPLSFTVLGESLPGRPFDGTVTAGTAVRIMTGAPLPAGADAVVPAEYATQTGHSVAITTTVSPFKHVGRIGEDVQTGETLLQTGRRLRPQDVGLLASLGIVEVAVIRRPVVRLLITGNELVQPGKPKSPFQIYESNSSMLCGLIERDGGVVESVLFPGDDRATIRTVLTEPAANGNEPDVILISGGSSVGAEDHAPTLLAEAGELAFHGIAMRPSSPAGVGRLGESFVFLQPGNPVSCLCAYDFFAGKTIRRLGGRTGDWPYATRSLPLERKISSAVGRVDYCRVAVIDGRVMPLALSGASILSSTTRADGFVIVPAPLEGYPPGSEVTVYLYDAAS